MKRRDLRSWNNPSSSPLWLTLACLPYATCLLAGPLPQTAGWPPGLAIPGMLQNTPCLPEPFPSALSPPGLAGAAWSRQQLRRSIRAQGFLLCPIHLQVWSSTSALVCSNTPLPSCQCCNWLQEQSQHPAFQDTPKGILPVAACSITGAVSEMKGLKKVPQGTCFLQHLPCTDDPHSPPSYPCLNPEHSIPKHSSSRGLGAVMSPQQLGLPQPTRHQLLRIHATNETETGSSDRLLAAAHSLQSSLMANPSSLLWQERCSPNNYCPSSSPPQPSEELKCRQIQREALHQPVWFSILYLPFDSKEAQVSKYSCTQLLSKCLVSFCFLFL